VRFLLGVGTSTDSPEDPFQPELCRIIMKFLSCLAALLFVTQVTSTPFPQGESIDNPLPAFDYSPDFSAKEFLEKCLFSTEKLKLE
jgi:hypothetical protein